MTTGGLNSDDLIDAYQIGRRGGGSTEAVDNAVARIRARNPRDGYGVPITDGEIKRVLHAWHQGTKIAVEWRKRRSRF